MPSVNDLTPEYHEEQAAALLGQNASRVSSVTAMAQAHAVLAISLRMRDEALGLAPPCTREHKPTLELEGVPPQASSGDLNEVLAAGRLKPIEVGPSGAARIT